MVGNVVAILGNIVTILDGKMTIMDIYTFGRFWIFGVVYYRNFFGLIGHHTCKIHKKFILCQKNKILVALFISYIYLYMEKKLIFQ